MFESSYMPYRERETESGRGSLDGKSEKVEDRERWGCGINGANDGLPAAMGSALLMVICLESALRSDGSVNYFVLKAKLSSFKIASLRKFFRYN